VLSLLSIIKTFASKCHLSPFKVLLVNVNSDGTADKVVEAALRRLGMYFH